MYKPIGMMKHKYISPNTDTIKCTTNNICNTSTYYNDEPPVIEIIGAKAFNDVWDEGWDEEENEENNNFIYSNLWE